MSAICGIYYLDGRPVALETGTAMMRELGIYHVDDTGVWRDGHVFLGCHARHVTPESVQEILPFYDDEAGLSITADAVIDNRVDLHDRLSIDYSLRDDMTDSQLILQAYRKWDQDCLKYLIGDFSFVIWDEKRQKLFCAVDHTGTRALYYFHSSELFAFSTLIKPLFVLPEITKEYDENWIADFLAMPSVMHQLDAELTLYRNIYLLPAGHTLTVCPSGAEKRVYWQIERYNELKLKTDHEYEEALLEVLGEAIRCRMRSIRPVGVMMSGGLDSTSVACLAARKMAVRGLRVQVFSAVPMLGYRDWVPVGMLADETPLIEAVREHTGNIDVTYCRSEGKHSLSDTSRFLAVLEQPYKIIENLLWIDSIMMTAQECNIGVMLIGSAGNITISWGDSSSYLISLLKSGQWWQFLRESRNTARRYRRPLKAWLRLMGTMLPYNLKININKIKDRDWQKKMQGLSPINPDFARHINVQERFRRFGYDPYFLRQLDSFESRKKHFKPDLFSHLGVITTKQSLAYGMSLRDPTMDKRVIEFCLSLPENQYVRNGRNRFLIRRAMNGILPDEVRQNVTMHGKQNADLAQRLQSCWTELAEEIKDIGILETERKYLDIAKIRVELEKYKTIYDDAADDFGLRMLIRSLIFSRFLRQ